MKKNILVLILVLLTIYPSFAQTTKDTIRTYLNNKVIELMSPHTQMSFSFGTAELKNKLPKLEIEIPNLKDTTDLIKKLKGTYNDWIIFKEIADLYKRFNNNKVAYSYYEKAYNTIVKENQKDSTKSKPYSDMGTLYMELNNNQKAFQHYLKAYEINSNDTAAC